jgi:hypothetical protein
MRASLLPRGCASCCCETSLCLFKLCLRVIQSHFLNCICGFGTIKCTNLNIFITRFAHTPNTNISRFKINCELFDTAGLAGACFKNFSRRVVAASLALAPRSNANSCCVSCCFSSQ